MAAGDPAAASPDVQVPETTAPVDQDQEQEESHDVENQTNLPDGYILLRTSDSESTEALEVVPAEPYAASSMSYQMSVLLALGIIAGVLVFNLLSRRWSS